MRHSFRFPRHFRHALKVHIERAISNTSPERYRQEPAYTAALARSLEGEIYNSEDGFIRIEATVIDDRGRGAAEEWSGADLAIVATISNPHELIKKAILIQAKLGTIERMSPSLRGELFDQIRKMKELTRSPQVMEIHELGGRRKPRIVSANKLMEGDSPSGYDLSDYFVRRVLTTLDGDTRPRFIEGVSNSRLTSLKILAKTIGL